MEEKTWLGTGMQELYEGNGPYSFAITPISPSKHHTVLYELPINMKTLPRPHRNSQNRHWDEDYVRMPFSPKNLFPAQNVNGEEVLKPRWNLIKEALSKEINSSQELEEAINSYNTRLPKFGALHYFLNEHVDQDERCNFFETLLPAIVQLALKLPEIVPGNIPLLKKDVNRSISLSQMQIACLLANGFLCTFPWRKEVSNSYPGFNFSRLFAASSRPKRQHCVAEKLKCVVHYFRRVLLKMPCGVVTFERKFIPRNQMPRWDKLDNNLGNTKIHVSSTGTIEDNSPGLLQVDFANKFVGGGVLGYGGVQEEIRYAICPELILSRLFTEELGSTESLVVTGVERYSEYNGYGDTFTWSGDFRDETPYDVCGRRKTSVVAIDATKFNRPSDQFNSSPILRELNKAYAGFHLKCDGRLSPVATGNWGCGAFKGDPKLKFLIQLMACSASRRNMVYYTFNNSELMNSIYNIHLFLANNRVMIYELWRLLCRFTATKLQSEDFIPFIQQAYFDKQPPQQTITKFYPKTERKQEPSRSTIENGPSAINGATKQINETIKQNDEASKQREEADDVIKQSDDSIEEDYPCISDSDSDIIESSQKDFPSVSFYKKKETSKPSVFDLVNAIDGDDNVKEKEEAKPIPSFLSALDEISKKADESKKLRDVCIDMEVDEVDENPIVVRDAVVRKKKISDYFAKINK